MTTLTYEQAAALLDRAVDEKGEDYHYPESEKAIYPTVHVVPLCSYYVKDADGHRPSCIIGHIIEYLGLREAFLAQRSDYEGTPGVGVLKNLGVTFKDLTAENLLDEAQQLQDMGSSWGHAVDAAKPSVLL